MTKVFCDHCGMEMPRFGGVYIDKIKGKWEASNCLTSNPDFEATGLVYCGKECAKFGLRTIIDKVEVKKNYI